METWDISTVDVQPHQPEVLASSEEGRVIAINLPAGEALDDHQVHEADAMVQQCRVQRAQCCFLAAVLGSGAHECATCFAHEGTTGPQITG